MPSQNISEQTPDMWCRKIELFGRSKWIIMKTIYETIGAAKEYCDYAVDIYENCPHKCSYCYAKSKVELHNKEFIFNGVRSGVIAETRLFLKSHKELREKMVFLGFSSDAFPVGEDITSTIEMIKTLKEFGCKVMVCTKGRLTEDVKTALALDNM